MAGSTFGTLFKIMTWGESHGEALGVVIDGCPSGLKLDVSDIQAFLDRRKPGQSDISTPRKEDDKAEILSGIFDGRTTGTPISIMVRNTNQRSADYDELANIYRPGHADFTYDLKYLYRDKRGGGRASGRETIGRVAAGAVAVKILNVLGTKISAQAIFDENKLTDAMKKGDSIGSIVECRISGAGIGLGEPVFDKLDAKLTQAIMSIGAVKAVEIGAGCAVSTAYGSENNDEFLSFDDYEETKRTNNSGGILGGLSDGDEIFIRAHFKPTPSISLPQKTVNIEGEPIEVQIKGRHDPVIAPRAAVVVESMAAIVLLDLLLIDRSRRMLDMAGLANVTADGEK